MGWPRKTPSIYGSSIAIMFMINIIWTVYNTQHSSLQKFSFFPLSTFSRSNATAFLTETEQASRSAINKAINTKPDDATVGLSVTVRSNAVADHEDKDQAIPNPNLIEKGQAIPNTMNSTNQNSVGNGAKSHDDMMQIIHSRLQWLNNPIFSEQEKQQTVKLQIERMSRILQGCQRLPEAKSEQNGIPAHQVFFSFRNVTWCSVPKTGTSNNLRLVCLMIGSNCTDKIPTAHGGEHEFVRRFVQRVSYMHIDKQAFTYAFVRNPWERLVSTYIQKFLYSDEYLGVCYVKSKHLQFHKAKMAANETWTFRDFLTRCVIGEYERVGLHQMEPHWRPQYSFSEMCDANYSYIGTTDTYNDDMGILLKMYGVEKPQSLLEASFKHRKPNEQSGVTKLSYGDYWKTIESELIKKLQTIYQRDFLYFGFPSNPI